MWAEGAARAIYSVYRCVNPHVMVTPLLTRAVISALNMAYLDLCQCSASDSALRRFRAARCSSNPWASDIFKASAQINGLLMHTLTSAGLREDGKQARTNKSFFVAYTSTQIRKRIVSLFL